MMIRIVSIAAILLLLGGGAYWWFFMRDAGPEMAEEPPPPIIVQLDPINISVIRGGAVAKYVLLRIALQVTSELARDFVLQRMPKLKNVIIRNLHEYFAEIPLNSPVNSRVIRNRLRATTAEVVGAKAIEDVIIQGAFERKPGDP